KVIATPVTEIFSESPVYGYDNEKTVVDIVAVNQIKRLNQKYEKVRNGLLHDLLRRLARFRVTKKQTNYRRGISSESILILNSGHALSHTDARKSFALALFPSIRNHGRKMVRTR
ncbi:MAG TPA: hypothetical protein PKK76_12655, partial [Leptospiraceae bacterium]|nr:hypothetical protein [Leptospiraceae bacterium]